MRSTKADTEALDLASIQVRRIAVLNGYYTDQMAWDCLSGKISPITRLSVDRLKKIVRRELDAQGHYEIRER